MDPASAPSIDAALAHEAFVRATARAVLGADDRVDDVVQDSLVAALRTGPRAVGALRAWLGTVARRRAVDVRRRDAARRRAEGATGPATATPSADEIAVREEVRRALVDELLALDAPSRDVLVLRFYEDLPPRDVAARLGIPVETVRTRTRRAVERLRARLDARRGGRRAWAVPLAAVAGLSAVPVGAVPSVGGVVWAAAALLAVAVVGGVWAVVGRDAHDGEGPAVVAVSADGDGRLAPLPPRGPARGPAQDGVACGVVGYVTADGAPAQAVVAARRLPEGRGAEPVAALERETADAVVSTDARGRFELDGLPTGAYVLTVTARDGRGRFTEVALLDPGARVRCRVDLTGGSTTLRARVVEPDGTPARGVAWVVQASRDDAVGGWLPVRLDADGRCVLAGLTGGLVRVGAAVVGRARAAYGTLPLRDDEVVWTLDAEGAPAPRRRPGVVEGRVRAADSRTVGGVRVRASLAPSDPNDRSRREGEAVADADGRFRIEGLGVGEVTVWVLDLGWMSKGLAEVRLGRYDPLAVRTDAGGDATVVVEVVPAATVRGRLVDERGQPLARAVVALDDEPDDARTVESWNHPPLRGRWRTVTGADGRFVFDDAVPGRRYAFDVEAPEVVTVAAAPVVAPAERDVVARTFDPTAWVDVEVVDEATGTALGGAHVSLVAVTDTGTLTVGVAGRTDARGRATLGPLPRGSLRVAVRHPDAVGAAPEVAVAAPSVRVALRTGRSISGRVTLDRGLETLIGISFDVGRADGTPVRERLDVGDDGRFSTGPLEPGRYRLAFRTIVPSLVGEVEATDGDRDLVVVLAPAAEGEPARADEARRVTPWRFEFRTASGGVVSRGTLHFVSATGRQSFGFEDPFLLRVTGDPMRATVQVTGACDASGTPLPVAAAVLPARTYGAEGGTVRVTFPPERPIEGVVRGPDGAPRAGVVVTATPRRDGVELVAVGSARTDAAGRFRLGGTDEGEHVLRSDAPPGTIARERVARGGDTDVSLVLDAVVAARLRVVDAAGAVVAGARVVVRRVGAEAGASPFDDDVAARATTGADGVARAEGLDPTLRYDVEVTTPADRADCFDGALAGWAPGDVTVPLARAFAVRGRVLDLDGQPIAGASVSATSLDAAGRPAAHGASDAQGRFVVRPLVAGAVRVSVAYHWAGRAELDARAGDDVGDVRIERGLPLRVRVADWPGRPRGRAWMPLSCTGRTAEGKPWGTYATQTEDGTWTLPSVRAGLTCRVYVGGWPDGRYVLGTGLVGREEPHVLAPAQGLELTGRLEGTPEDLASVDLSLEADGATLPAYVERDGEAFRFAGVPPGRVTVVARRRFTLVGRVEVEAGARDVTVAVAAR